MKERIRIKDIAERAGVSVGTVDRVLHNRPNVSATALEKVKKALQEANYRPNMYASALAYNRSYTFYCLMPAHTSETYWVEIEQGIDKAIDFRRDFHIQVVTKYYQRFDNESFISLYEECLELKPDGFVIVPAEPDVTKMLTDILHRDKIPFVMLDSYMPELKPLAFFGQDSFQSGYFAAKMLMLIAHNQKEIMIMKQTKNGRVASKQQENREVGFRHYMGEFFPDVVIHEVDLPMEEERKQYSSMLEEFFTSHQDVNHCITLNSKAHIVGEFLLTNGYKGIQIMGYDMVEKNVRCVKNGSISFLIAQHAYMQGFYSIDTLVKAIVLKHKVRAVNYMPIELLSKENIDFYHRESI